jgi:hypothetical protein
LIGWSSKKGGWPYAPKQGTEHKSHADMREETKKENENWTYSTHLIDENAEGPPVDRLGVTSADNDLRGKILRSPAQRPAYVRAEQESGRSRDGWDGETRTF